MAKATCWYASLHVAVLLSCFCEKISWSAFEIIMHIYRGSLHRYETEFGIAMPAPESIGSVLHGINSVGALAMGLLFDRAGPRACLLASHLGFIGMAAIGWMFGSSLVPPLLAQALHFFQHAFLALRALGSQHCPADDRGAFFAHTTLAQQLGYWLAQQLLPVMSLATMVGTALVSLALSFYVSSGPAGRVSAKPAGFGRPPEEARGRPHEEGPFISHSPSPSAASLPVPSTMLPPWVHESFWRIISRPVVRVVFITMFFQNFAHSGKDVCSAFAIQDSSQPTFTGPLVGRVVVTSLMGALFTWAFVCGPCVRRLGPNNFMQILLLIRALAELAMAVSFCSFLPVRSWMGDGAGVYSLCVIVSACAKVAMDNVSQVLLVGMVGVSERGTLMSLEHFIGYLPKFGLSELVYFLYMFGGVPGIWGTSFLISGALLLMLRRSKLQGFRLKEM